MEYSSKLCPTSANPQQSVPGSVLGSYGSSTKWKAVVLNAALGNRLTQTIYLERNKGICIKSCV